MTNEKNDDDGGLGRLVLIVLGVLFLIFIICVFIDTPFFNSIGFVVGKVFLWIIGIIIFFYIIHKLG